MFFCVFFVLLGGTFLGAIVFLICFGAIIGIFGVFQKKMCWGVAFLTFALEIVLA